MDNSYQLHFISRVPNHNIHYLKVVDIIQQASILATAERKNTLFKAPTRNFPLTTAPLWTKAVVFPLSPVVNTLYSQYLHFFWKESAPYREVWAAVFVYNVFGCEPAVVPVKTHTSSTALPGVPHWVYSVNRAAGFCDRIVQDVVVHPGLCDDGHTMRCNSHSNRIHLVCLPRFFFPFLQRLCHFWWDGNSGGLRGM